MRKVIVAGSRDFNDYEFLEEIMNNYLGGDIVEIVSGTAKGADSLGERYAKENGHNLVQYKAEWSKYLQAAGFIRNEDMARHASELVVFWDGKSKGTKHMLQEARRRGLHVEMFIYD